MNIYNQTIDFRKTKPQKYFDPWDKKKTHVIFMGVCPVCEVRMYGFSDDRYPDPRGVLGKHTAYCLDPADYSMTGDDFNVCFDCSNTRETYELCLSMAKKEWVK